MHPETPSEATNNLESIVYKQSERTSELCKEMRRWMRLRAYLRLTDCRSRCHNGLAETQRRNPAPQSLIVSRDVKNPETRSLHLEEGEGHFAKARKLALCLATTKRPSSCLCCPAVILHPRGHTHTLSREWTSNLTACSARFFTNVHFFVHLQNQNKAVHRVILGTARTQPRAPPPPPRNGRFFGQDSDRERAEICCARGRRHVTAKGD